MKVKKSKNTKNTKKYLAGGALAIAGMAQGALGLGQGIFGLTQQGKANKELDRLRKNKPAIFVPTALRKLANEPVSREYMDTMEEGSQRRTSQAVGALGKGGSRALVGGLPSVLDNERIGERERAAQYEQERKRALGALGQAELGVQDRKMRQYEMDVAGARGELGAGQTNTFTGIESALSATPYIPFTKESWNKAFRGEKGMKMQVTDGKFSHDKNPLTLVTKEGEVARDKNSGAQIELTGQETVIAPKDIKKMTKLAEQEDSELAKNFLKLMKSFKSKK